jgi:hypothetical protein
MMFRASSGATLALSAALVLLPLCSVLALASCSSDDPPGDAEPTCLAEPGPLDCNGLYGYDPADGKVKPTFDEVYRVTLKPRCATSSCHSGTAPAGGFQLGTADEAFEALHADGSNGIPRVTGGDIACGKVIVRIETHGMPWSMPRGTPLDDPNLCSVRNWINNGAER